MVRLCSAVLDMVDGRRRGEVIVVEVQRVNPNPISEVLQTMPFLGGEPPLALASDAMTEKFKAGIRLVANFLGHAPCDAGLHAVGSYLDQHRRCVISIAPSQHQQTPFLPDSLRQRIVEIAFSKAPEVVRHLAATTEHVLSVDLLRRVQFLRLHEQHELGILLIYNLGIVRTS